MLSWAQESSGGLLEALVVALAWALPFPPQLQASPVTRPSPSHGLGSPALCRPQKGRPPPILPILL